MQGLLVLEAVHGDKLWCALSGAEFHAEQVEVNGGLT